MPSLSRTRLGTAAVLAAAMAALLTSALLATPPATAATNLVSDPGFESGLAGWTCDAGTAATVSAPVHTGTQALAGTPSNVADAQCTQTISVVPNSSYTLTAYVQGSYVYLGATGSARGGPGRA